MVPLTYELSAAAKSTTALVTTAPAMHNTIVAQGI
jgi:hypothetical protein